MFVDPRRPTVQMSEMRDEGVIPYTPELPIPPDAIINYNQTVDRARGIHTAPSGLESTSLVLVYGLGKNSKPCKMHNSNIDFFFQIYFTLEWHLQKLLTC